MTMGIPMKNNGRLILLLQHQQHTLLGSCKNNGRPRCKQVRCIPDDAGYCHLCGNEFSLRVRVEETVS